MSKKDEKTPEEVTIEALEFELSGYERDGKTDRAAEVKKEIAKLKPAKKTKGE